MTINKNILLSTLVFLFTLTISGQSEWQTPEESKKHLSIREFDEEFTNDGQVIYENSCLSCHGNPSMANYTLMVPAPGDPAESKFQIQTDGELFYKVQKGRGSMPGFEDVLSEEEIWSLVSFMRSFNPEYIQERPSLEGIEIPEYKITFEFDENVDKLVVKVYEGEEAVEGVLVSAFIKGMFGNHSLGKKQTSELGIAYFDVDAKIPGDEEGNLTIIAKATKGYGSAKLTQKVKAVEPNFIAPVTSGRHLWSPSNKAPVWLRMAFFAVFIGIWGTIFYILIGLRKVKKHS
jgi:cytochrome c5